jgi:hypothetical protein
MKKKKKSKGLLWIILICIVALAGFYYRRPITSRLADYVAKSRSLAPLSERHPSQETKNTKAPTAKPTKPIFTFMPDEKSHFGWLIKYPDGRVFKFGEEFNSDCTPSLKLARAPATVRFEFVEQRSCNFAARKSIQVDAASLRDVNGDGSPELIASVITGGNVNGHAANLISLTPKGPRVVRRME